MNFSLSNYKVSIIVAIYNIEMFIGKCIDSIIKQDHTNLEIILVDDCSTDNSGKICDDFAMKDKRIKVIHHKANTHQPGVRNDGIDASTGEFIVFVDGDDWLAPDFISYMLKVIISTKSDMGINLVNFTSRDYIQVKKTRIVSWSAEKALSEILYPHITVGCWNKIYRADFLKKNDLRFKTHLFTAEGDRFIIDAVQQANLVGVGCRKVYYYRLNNINSAVTKYDLRQPQGAIKAFEEIREDLIIKTPLTIKALEQHIWLNYVWYLRELIALDKQSTEKSEYKKAIKFIKSNYLNIVRNECSLRKKISFSLTGLFPVLTSKIRNKLYEHRLRKDVKRLEEHE